MRDERVVLDRLMRERQRKMVLRQGGTPARKTEPERERATVFSPFDVAGPLPGDKDPGSNIPDNDASNAAPQSVGMLRHNGYREVARNSKSSYRGFTIVNGREVQHESGIERRAVSVFQTWHDVSEIYSQRPKVEYPDDDGVLHDYVFDYLLILTDGTHIAVSVKPEKARADEEKKLKQIVSIPQVALDSVFLMTDLLASRAAAFNARLILWARELVTENAVEQAREIMWLSGSSFYFWQLFDHGVPHYLRRAAIVRLIDLGEIAPTEPHRRIRDYSLLSRVR